jgi:transcriptional regulator with XRE-family HTH domain
VKGRLAQPSTAEAAEDHSDSELGQLIYDLCVEASVSQQALAERMGTTQSVILRLEEGEGARTRIDTLARVATAWDDI